MANLLNGTLRIPLPMSDTFVSTPHTTRAGSMIIAKNSDREPNEAQSIVRIPAKEHRSRLAHATYITVPQVDHTYEMILSKPYNVWGAEMGVNEHKVVITNQAVFTKNKTSQTEPSLTGMDLVRLGLERSQNAEEALECITELLAEFGQNSHNGKSKKWLSYHNSFVIADPRDAILLETAGKEWAACKIWGFRSVANTLTIERDYDLLSEQAMEMAYKHRWIGKNDAFNFRKAYHNSMLEFMHQSKSRLALTTSMGKAAERNMDIRKAIVILQSHSTLEEKFEPSKNGHTSISMHAGANYWPSQTNSSMVVEIRPHSDTVIWLTGTSIPEISLFKPFYLSGRSLMQGEWLEPTGSMDESLWWKHEQLYRNMLPNFKEAKQLFSSELAKYQDELIAKEAELVYQNLSTPELDKLCMHNIWAHYGAIEAWTRKVKDQKLKPTATNPLYRMYWRAQNKAAKITLEA